MILEHIQNDFEIRAAQAHYLWKKKIYEPFAIIVDWTDSIFDFWVNFWLFFFFRVFRWKKTISMCAWVCAASYIALSVRVNDKYALTHICVSSVTEVFYRKFKNCNFGIKTLIPIPIQINTHTQWICILDRIKHSLQFNYSN